MLLVNKKKKLKRLGRKSLSTAVLLMNFKGGSDVEAKTSATGLICSMLTRMELWNPVTLRLYLNMLMLL